MIPQIVPVGGTAFGVPASSPADPQPTNPEE
jgi:hypothetical protein